MPPKKVKKTKQATTKRKQAAHQKQNKQKASWFVRFFMALIAMIGFIIRKIWFYARKNMPLALGVGVFGVIFIWVVYNAFLQQDRVKRPVLFSTRSKPTVSSSSAKPDKASKPFVEKAITTKSLIEKDKESVTQIPAEKPVPLIKPKDPIANFLEQNRDSNQNLTKPKTQIQVVPTRKPKVP